MISKKNQKQTHSKCLVYLNVLHRSVLICPLFFLINQHVGIDCKSLYYCEPSYDSKLHVLQGRKNYGFFLVCSIMYHDVVFFKPLQGFSYIC